MKYFAKFLADEAGVTAIEYALIAAATGLSLVAIMPLINSALRATYTSLSNGMS
jgi:pilus assembly protein Flp/PilA